MDPLTEKSKQVARKMKELTDIGKYAEAYKVGFTYLNPIASTYQNQEIPYQDLETFAAADFWLEYGRAIITINPRDPVFGSIEKAILDSPSGSKEIILGDFQRERALQAIRLGKFEEAENILEKVTKLHCDDKSRMAAIDSVKGIAFYYKGLAQRAIDLLWRANNVWVETEISVNDEWVARNRFYYLKSMVQKGYPQSEIDAALKMIQSNDEQELRRERAKFIAKSWARNKLDDIRQQLISICN